jgi:hypothetical protein
MTRRLSITRHAGGRRIAAVGLAAVAVMAAAPAALASHSGEIADCGAAGSYTLHATDTAAGTQAPEPGNVLLFEGGGTLTVQEVWRDGQLRFSNAATGRTKNAVDEVTCTFTNGAGSYFEITGVLTAR